MTLAEVVKQYRAEHDMSQRTFAKLAKMSNTSLKNIEDGVTITPRVDSLKNIASAMGITLAELFNSIDSSFIFSLREPSQEEKEDELLLSLFDSLNDAGRTKLMDYATVLSENPRYQAKGKRDQTAAYVKR
jgi:transcriptional regulator with XRE-family HTH domain